MQMPLIHDMFYLALPVAEKILRPILVYVFLIVGLRLAGKRELAQLNPAIIGDDNSVTGGVIGAATLLIVNYWVVRLLYGHEKLERLVEGHEDVLIENGVIRMDKLKEELITMTELQAAAHKQGFASLDQIDKAILDPGGTVAFFGKAPSPEAERHVEVMRRLDQLTAQVAALRS